MLVLPEFSPSLITDRCNHGLPGDDGLVVSVRSDTSCAASTCGGPTARAPALGHQTNFTRTSQPRHARNWGLSLAGGKIRGGARQHPTSESRHREKMVSEKDGRAEDT